MRRDKGAEAGVDAYLFERDVVTSNHAGRIVVQLARGLHLIVRRPVWLPTWEAFPEISTLRHVLSLICNEKHLLVPLITLQKII